MPFLYWIGIILVGTILSSILYYFNITGDKINKIILYLISIVGITIGSFKFGMSMNKKGIISGLIFFSVVFVIMMIISLTIFKTGLTVSSIIYYLILLIFAVLGSIIGKNKKEEAKT